MKLSLNNCLKNTFGSNKRMRTSQQMIKFWIKNLIYQNKNTLTVKMNFIKVEIKKN